MRRCIPEQSLTREQAIRFYTINNAFLMFEEDAERSLEPGKLADFIVLDRDILTCPVDEVKDIKVEATYLSGARRVTPRRHSINRGFKCRTIQRAPGGRDADGYRQPARLSLASRLEAPPRALTQTCAQVSNSQLRKDCRSDSPSSSRKACCT